MGFCLPQAVLAVPSCTEVEHHQPHTNRALTSRTSPPLLMAQPSSPQTANPTFKEDTATLDKAYPAHSKSVAGKHSLREIETLMLKVSHTHLLLQLHLQLDTTL